MLSLERAAAGVAGDFATGTFTEGARFTALAGIEEAVGSAFDDRLTASAQVSTLSGGAGNDELIAAAGGGSLLFGDAASDLSFLASGGSVADWAAGEPAAGGDDHLRSNGLGDVLAGGGGSDSYSVQLGADGAAVILDSSGHDTLAIGSRTAGVVLGADDIWLRQNNQDLEILVAGGTAGNTATGSITVAGYFRDPALKVEEIDVGSRKLVGANTDLLVSQMAGHAAFEMSASTGGGKTVGDSIARLWIAPAA